MRFEHKKVIVTGANRSIGREIALTLAKDGADVVISYRSDKNGAESVVAEIEKLGRKALAVYADFSKNADIESFYKQVLDFHGHIDYLVNNAGMLARDNFFELTPEKMAMVYQVNTIAPFYLMQLCARDMIEKNIKGSIVNISSIAGTFTAPRGAAYASSKAAMNKYTQNAAFELADYHVRVNTVAPGVIEAGMNEDTAKTNPELWKEYSNAIPLKRAGTPADIANMVAFLLSTEAEWVTGKVFEVDGGHVL